MHHVNEPRTRKGNTRVAFRDVSNQFSGGRTNHAKAVKRVKSLEEATGLYSSGKNCDKLSTEVSAKHVHSSSISHPNVGKIQDATNEISCDSKGPVFDIAVNSSALKKVSSNPSQREFIASSGRVRDIDDSTDPLLVTAYVKQMYAYYRVEEHRAVVGPYLQSQREINARMRAILVDWLCEVHHKWRLHPETLFLTVNILDRYLAKKEVTKKTLQLVGSCALFIASKYEEIYPTPIGDLVYVCDGAYDHNDVVIMEEKMLRTLNYQISLPTIYKFLVRYLNAANPSKMLCYMSSYIAEVSLLSYDMIKEEYKPSQLAAAAVLVGRKSIGRNRWSSTLVEFSGYREEDILPIARRMLAVMSTELNSSADLVALKHKYGRRSMSSVANITLPEDI